MVRNRNPTNTNMIYTTNLEINLFFILQMYVIKLTLPNLSWEYYKISLSDSPLRYLMIFSFLAPLRQI